MGIIVGVIINQLYQEGILVKFVYVKLYLKILGKEICLQVGDYKFFLLIFLVEVLVLLQDGCKCIVMFILLEGWICFEIVVCIVNCFLGDLFMLEVDVFSFMDQVGFIVEFDLMVCNFEGYLFFIIYELEMDVIFIQIVLCLVQEFVKVWEFEWDQWVIELGCLCWEIVIIVSLIENELKVQGERFIVVLVIYNWFECGILLGLDVINVYIVKLLNCWDGILYKSDFEVDYFYNI